MGAVAGNGELLIRYSGGKKWEGRAGSTGEDSCDPADTGSG